MGTTGQESTTTDITFITVVKEIQPVQFTDTSVGATTVLWDFGDDNTSEERNPLHEYTSNGTFFVTLTGYNEFGENSTTQTITVSGIGTDSYEEEVEVDGEEEVRGCTDTRAINYDENANTDDGSCEYDDDSDLGDTDTTDSGDDDSYDTDDKNGKDGKT